MQEESGIHVTRVGAPETGYAIAAHCAHCRRTVIVYSPYAAAPENGGLYALKGICLDEDEHSRTVHNLYPQFDYPYPDQIGPRPGEWTDEAFAHRWNPMGIPVGL